jgi:hypothetical protein
LLLVAGLSSEFLKLNTGCKEHATGNQPVSKKKSPACAELFYKKIICNQ